MSRRPRAWPCSRCGGSPSRRRNGQRTARASRMRAGGAPSDGGRRKATPETNALMIILMTTLMMLVMMSRHEMVKNQNPKIILGRLIKRNSNSKNNCRNGEFGLENFPGAPVRTSSSLSLPLSISLCLFLITKCLSLSLLPPNSPRERAVARWLCACTGYGAVRQPCSIVVSCVCVFLRAVSCGVSHKVEKAQLLSTLKS